ncbi:hypothetical protein [Antrihabitans stalactiti]|nr:hypothetical protein [Antrihabitans stalactiti]
MSEEKKDSEAIDAVQDRGTGVQRRRKAVRRAGPPVGDAPVAPITLRKSSTESASARPAAPKPVEKNVDSKTAVAVDKPVRKPNMRLRALAAAAAVVVVALAAAVVFLTHANDQTDQRDAQRQEYIQAARQVVLDLTTITPDNAKAVVDRILENATGEFKTEFDGRIDPFVSIVREAKVSTNGEIIDAGLESESGDGGVVLVAAKTMVTNAGSDTPQPRNFRLRVSITDVDGRLATSKVEFVP